MADREGERPDIRENMARSVITGSLLGRMKGASDQTTFDVIIALNELYESGVAAAAAMVQGWLNVIAAETPADLRPKEEARVALTSHYVFTCLTKHTLMRLASMTREFQMSAQPAKSPIYRIWEDSAIETTLTHSLRTVKADAAHRAFNAFGGGIVWAVLDSGIEGTHEHLVRKATPFGVVDPLNIQAPLLHLDYTADGRDRFGDPAASTTSMPSALEDECGHGSHVGGIIAGFWKSKEEQGDEVVGTEIRLEGAEGTEAVKSEVRREKLTSISGMAPLCRLVSLKVIADRDLPDNRQGRRKGKVSWVLMAIDQIQRWNQHGKRLLIHGVNLSAGYEFDPRWFACGQSPICVEVNRLVRSGVSVVISAGNLGYTAFLNAQGQKQSGYDGMTITDPGNADLAITVGSTHRDMPHTYGVSYFSSRGPTGDGRLKPDLLAPGERIISCATGDERNRFRREGVRDVLFCEQSGTSMAAPHVSGAIAAFLSVRNEFIGETEKIKTLLLDSAIDLGRDRTMQGRGLLDLMKLLQMV